MNAITHRPLLILTTIIILLFIPLIAMQFTSEVSWTPYDFLVMGALLLVTGLILELILRRFHSTKRRTILIALALIAFLLIWAELAVGIIGTLFAGS